MKTLRTITLGTLVMVTALMTAAGGVARAEEARNPQSTLPTNNNLLFWNQSERDAAFRAMERVPLMGGWHTVAPSATPRIWQSGPPLKLDVDVDAFLASQHSAALLIVQGGKLRLERYGLGFDGDNDRWTSFSVAKSFTSTLAGAAVRDGYIKSLDDKVSAYIPAMKGSAYDDVSVRQLLTMTSGVRWNEDYKDPNSDVARFGHQQPEPGVDTLVSYMRKLPRAAPAGTRWNYSTGETNLLGILVTQATGRPLAQYLQEKIWQPAGMAHEATWLLSKTGQEISGAFLQASPRDFARFGQFILEGARVNGQPIVPDDWLSAATTKRADINTPGFGYGYQWWTRDDGSFSARGIFGQGIFIDPRRQLVVVFNSSWPSAVDSASSAKREQFFQAVRKAVDAEQAGQGN
ncbi:serine hydrolase [Achromobacter sp. Marseille-Q0513]|uniref:serine hydrolase domain-containing protein n=1 Tax=Achromobacter sp. Marseille-Q0513 TaxID=2829161 RepID=UPI001B9232D6|nr:serine hydrolase [Achromobacter sp. Marseille-Q0513]MBR8656250.1 serine hydrolase [Achromobacter sp. Marseille-Q0513]